MSAFSYAYAMPDFMSQGCKDKGPHLITIVLVGWSGQYFFYDCSDFRDKFCQTGQITLF